MSELRRLSSEPTIDMGAISSYLDELDTPTRVDEVRSLARKHQARLFEAASGHRPISLDDLVPSDKPAMQEVVHHGKNTLPAFSHFAKVFVRPDRGAPELWGYNRAGGFVETVVGPGYFVAYPHETPGEILVDYLRVPPGRVEGWPPILPNSARLSVFVYNGTQDVLRGVSNHVTIGRAFKGKSALSAWFVLCRSEG